MKLAILAAVCAGALAASIATAKLPAPAPLTDDQKAAAEAAKAKAAHGGQVANFQLCRSMDRAAANHARNLKAQGKEFKADAAPACVDPGPLQQSATAAPAKK